jgi:hypothetical protein
MSSAAAACAELTRALFDRMRELEQRDPHGVAQVVAAMVAHLRSWRPESVAPLGTLPDPEGPATDPRLANPTVQGRTAQTTHQSPPTPPGSIFGPQS